MRAAITWRMQVARDGIEESVEHRTARGVLQAISVTAVTAPAAFAIIVVLGRISPEALGYYALLTLLVGLFGGLLTLGGPAVAARAAADAGVHPTRATYAQGLIVPFVAAAVAAPFALVPPLRGHVSAPVLAALAISVAAWTAAQGATTATVRFGATSILQNVPTLVQCALFAACALLAPQFIRGNARALIEWSYVVPFALIGMGYARWLVRRARQQGGFGPAPRGLSRLIAGVQLILVLSFIFEAGERLAALASPGSLATLGKYFAGVQIAYLVRRLPAIVGQGSLPGLAALRGTGRERTLHANAAEHLVFASFALGSGLVVLSPAVPVLLGRRYEGTATVVAVVAIACAATSAWPLDSSYATALNRLGLYQLSLLAGTVAFIPLLFSQRLLLLAVCRASALVVSQLVMAVGLREFWSLRVLQLALVGALGASEFALTRVAVTPLLLPLIWAVGFGIYLVAARAVMAGPVTTPAVDLR